MSRPKRNTFDVFVGNLPNDVDKGYVDHMFRTCGEISSVSVFPSKYHKFKIAYIRFYCEPDALKAVEKYRTLTLNGNALDVKLMPPKNQNNGSSVKNASPFSNNLDGLPSGNYEGSSTDAGMASTVFSQKPFEVTIVCHIENPVTFYGQSISNLLEISKISEKLQMYSSTFSPVQGLPHINQIYAARFSQDQMWYRCRIIHPDMNRSFVSYIDYGNAEHVGSKDIMLLPDDLVKVPPQSSMFVFKDLKPVTVDENKELYEKAIRYMKKMINEKVQLDTVFSTDSFHYVNRCICQDKDIYEEIQKKGFAKKIQSVNEKCGPPEKTKLNVPVNNKKNGDSPLNPKGKIQQNAGSKPNPQSTRSGSSTADATVKKYTAKYPSKESAELEALRLEKAKLTKDLALERQKSKALLKEIETLKAKANDNCFEKLDFVIHKIQQLMVMRNQQISLEDKDSLEEIYDVIQTKFLSATQMLPENSDLHEKVEKAILEYRNAVEEVGIQAQESELPVLIGKRDESCKAACDLMKEYLESWNGDHLTEKVVYLKKLLLEMKQKYEQCLKTDVNSDDKSLEDLISEYRGSKLKNKTSVETALKNTNDALIEFSSAIDNLKKDITVTNGKGNEDTSSVRFNMATFAENFKEVQKAVDDEIIVRNKAPGSVISETVMVALVKTLINEIETPLEEALQQIKDCKQYSLLYPEMCNEMATKPDTTKIYEIRKEIKMLKSKLRHKLADKKDLEESDEVNTTALKEINASLDALLHELHIHFKMEHEEMMKLLNAYKMHYRELNISNPDLNLSSYVKGDVLVKEHWEIEHFNLCNMPKRPGVCYSAKFCDESVIIKEYNLNNDEYNQFLNEILPWHCIKEDNVVPVRAVFRSKTGFQTYAVFPLFSTLAESEKEYPLSQSHACHVLRDVLKGLAHIHSQDVVHSQLNPSTVLINSNTALLDFSLNLSHVNTVCVSKTILFCPPEKDVSQASDMYNFGCLILWMLFPNLQFTFTADGVLDIAPYKNIVQDLLSSSIYEAVASLLSAATSARPSAKSLLERGIFDELINNSSKEDPSPTSTPVSRTSEEISMVVSATPEECSEPTSSDAASSSDR